MRMAQARAVDAIHERIAKLVADISHSECESYLRNAGMLPARSFRLSLKSGSGTDRPYILPPDGHRSRTTYDEGAAHNYVSTAACCGFRWDVVEQQAELIAPRIAVIKKGPRLSRLGQNGSGRSPTLSLVKSTCLCGHRGWWIPWSRRLPSGLNLCDPSKLETKKQRKLTPIWFLLMAHCLSPALMTASVTKNMLTTVMAEPAPAFRMRRKITMPPRPS